MGLLRKYFAPTFVVLILVSVPGIVCIAVGGRNTNELRVQIIPSAEDTVAPKEAFDVLMILTLVRNVFGHTHEPGGELSSGGLNFPASVIIFIRQLRI